MKQILYILIAVLTLAFVSCKHGNGQKNTPQENATVDGVDAPESSVSEEANTLSQYDFLYLEDGVIYFYDLKTHEATPYEGETEEVVNVLCSPQAVMYYSTRRANRLLLKSLDLNVADAEPEMLADWGVTIEGNLGYGAAYGDMYFNSDKTQIGLERDINWWAGILFNIAYYDIATKTVSIDERYKVIMEGDEVTDVEFIDGDFVMGEIDFDDDSNEVFSVEDGYAYYERNGQRVCLNDKIDYDEAVGFDRGDCDLEILSLDPARKKVLIRVFIFMGDGVLGTFIMSSLDGKEQVVLEGTDAEGPVPQWLSDGSLLYGCLSLMDPEGKMINLAESCTYCVLPKTQK